APRSGRPKMVVGSPKVCAPAGRLRLSLRSRAGRAGQYGEHDERVAPAPREGERRAARHDGKTAGLDGALDVTQSQAALAADDVEHAVGIVVLLSGPGIADLPDA